MTKKKWDPPPVDTPEKMLVAIVKAWGDGPIDREDFPRWIGVVRDAVAEAGPLAHAIMEPHDPSEPAHPINVDGDEMPEDATMAFGRALPALLKGTALCIGSDGDHAQIMDVLLEKVARAYAQGYKYGCAHPGEKAPASAKEDRDGTGAEEARG